MTTENEPLPDVDNFAIQVPGRLIALEMLMIKLLKTLPLDERRALLDATDEAMDRMEAEMFERRGEDGFPTAQRFFAIARIALDHIGGHAIDPP